MKQIPNIFTLLNLFFGCIAIVFALQTESVIIYVNDEFSGSSFNVPEQLTWASIFIAVAAVIDFLDGFVARLLKASSEMGKQLDSLADVVSFGVAPGVIIYQLLRLSYAREENGLEISMIWLLPGFIVSCAAAYRLAKFNLDETQSYNFTGLPTPAMGLLVASFPLILHYDTSGLGLGNYIVNKWVLYGLVGAISYLMVSKIPFMGMKFRDYSFKNNFPRYLLIILAVMAVVIFHFSAVPVIFLLYFILSLIYKNKTA